MFRFKVYDKDNKLIFKSEKYHIRFVAEKQLQKYSLENKDAVCGYIIRDGSKPNNIAKLIRSIIKIQNEKEFSESENKDVDEARYILENHAGCEVIRL